MMFQSMNFNQKSGPVERIKFGIFELDRISGGYRTNDFIVIAASTGVGKSMIAQYIALSAARAGHKVMYIDYENDEQLVKERLTWFDIGESVKWHEIVKAGTLRFFMKSNEENKIVKNIILNQSQKVTQFIFQKLESIENAIILHQPKLLVIDLFSGLYKNVISTAQISQIVYLLSEEVSELAKKHNCAIIALEQLKGDRPLGVRPTPNHIATGQALTHKATKIITLFSYGKDNQTRIVSEAPPQGFDQFLEIIVCKDRTGDIPEKIYTVVKSHGIKQPSSNELTNYLDYVHRRIFK